MKREIDLKVERKSPMTHTLRMESIMRKASTQDENASLKEME